MKIIKCKKHICIFYYIVLYVLMSKWLYKNTPPYCCILESANFLKDKQFLLYLGISSVQILENNLHSEIIV